MHKTGWIAIAMLAVWAVGTLQNWPGWVHALLTGGVFLLIYAIIKGRGRGSAGT